MESDAIITNTIKFNMLKNIPKIENFTISTYLSIQSTIIPLRI